jgi:hypothetical protein
MKDIKATDLHNQQSGSVALAILDASLIFIILLLIYCLTFSGSFRIDDEHILVARAQSLAFWDHFHYPQVYGNDRVRQLSTVTEDVASPVIAIEPGQAVVGSILYQLASTIDVGGAQAYFTMNLYATAITGALVYLSVYILGFRRRTAILCSLIYGLGTMAWPYSKTAFRDPLVACMIAVTMLGWVVLVRKGGWARKVGLFLFLFGILGSLFFKSNVLALLPAFLISAVFLAIHHRKNAKIDKNWIWMGLLPLIFLLILSLFVSNPGPLSRFSLSYYIESLSDYWHHLNIQTLLGTLGPFFSPSKSVFLFNPIFLLLPWILVRQWHTLWYVALPTLLGAFFLALFQALHLHQHWAGTLVWGLRFMLPIMPLLSLLLAPWLDGLIHDGFNWKKSIAWLFIGLNVLIQCSGAVVAWYVPFKVWIEMGLDPYALGSIWRLEYLVIPQHIEALFQNSSWDIAWIRTFQSQWWVVILPILVISLIILGLICLGKRNLVIGKSRHRSGLVILFLTLAIFFPIFPSLWLIKADPATGGDSQELQQVVAWTEDEARDGDLIIVDSYGTNLWDWMMNAWDKPLPWYSLPYEIPGTGEVGLAVGEDPSPATLELFDKLGKEYSRLIYLTSQETPDFALAREETWLETNFNLEKEVEFSGSTFVKARIFSPH